MKEIQLERRECDCCGSSDLEEIWSYAQKCKTRNKTFLWKVTNVACRNCGFAFVSPSPTIDSLKEYYEDSFSLFSSKTVDYSIENRINIIKKYRAETRAKSYLEIGSNNCPEFISKVSTLFDRVETIEINNTCNSNYQSLNEVPHESIDIVTAYFVLEHIPKPKEFLLSIATILKSNGRLIIEVPNLYIYPKYPEGIFLYEHVNHFSPVSLSHLAKICGFNLVDISQINCSRPFGFVAIFKKADYSEKNLEFFNNKIEFIQARSYMQEGAHVIELFKKKLDSIRAMISKPGINTIIWGANNICTLLLQDYQLPPTSTVVDSDPQKSGFLSPVKVYLPHHVLDKIRKAELFIINTKIYAEDIKKWITHHTGRSLDNAKVIILEYL